MYALILAGGKGERLRPLTDHVPKPMVHVDGKPILWHQVRWLASAGVTDVVFLVGYLAEAVESYFGDGAAFGVRAHYSRELKPLGRGGALKLGLTRVPPQSGPVIATNGDVITDASLPALVADYENRARTSGAHAATILTAPMVSPYGIVDTDADGLVDQFTEKAPLPYWINGGVYVLDPGIRDLLPAVGDHETTTFPRLAEEGRMSAVGTDKFWRSVDSFQDLQEVERHLTSRITVSGEALS